MTKFFQYAVLLVILTLCDKILTLRECLIRFFSSHNHDNNHINNFFIQLMTLKSAELTMISAYLSHQIKYYGNIMEVISSEFYLIKSVT